MNVCFKGNRNIFNSLLQIQLYYHTALFPFARFAKHNFTGHNAITGLIENLT